MSIKEEERMGGGYGGGDRQIGFYVVEYRKFV